MEYHAGELAVQACAGVQVEAQALGQHIGASIQPTAQKFLQSQQLAIASTVDQQGRVWASLLTGQPGFVETINERTARITAPLIPADPLNQNLRMNNHIGLLIIDLANRRRLRMNGEAIADGNESLLIHTEQSYFNCPKYIQSRHIQMDVAQSAVSPVVQHFETLTQAQQDWIHQADTFFIASLHPESGADASHRGGYPGFVQVLNANTLMFPDYSGNNMFNTLGNLLINPKAGLLLIDFEQGNTLQLTGETHILWEDERLAKFAGAERLIEFHIAEVIETANATQLRWKFSEYSPANPKFGQASSAVLAA